MILQRYSTNPASSDNIMNDILECVRRDEMLAQIFKKFLSIVSPVYFRNQSLKFQDRKNLSERFPNLSTSPDLQSDPPVKAPSPDTSTSIQKSLSFNLK